MGRLDYFREMNHEDADFRDKLNARLKRHGLEAPVVHHDFGRDEKGMLWEWTIVLQWRQADGTKCIKTLRCKIQPYDVATRSHMSNASADNVAERLVRHYEEKILSDEERLIAQDRRTLRRQIELDKKLEALGATHGELWDALKRMKVK